jgi:hypothetical protein
MRTRGFDSAGVKARSAAGADSAAKPERLEPGQGRRAPDPRDSTETALLTKVPSWSDDDEPDGPESVAVRRPSGPAPRLPRRERLRRRAAAVRSCWPVLPILAVQAVFAWRLLRTNTAFLDEATYMWSGRLVIDHFLHGAGVPEFQTFFSGAPVIYPVIAAVASKLGGLTGARLLSLVFMLLATTAVYLTGRRLHGVLTGFFAAGLFAALGPTLHLSSYATFDAMALCLLAWSTYFVICFAYGASRNALIYAALFMVLADCTKYACLLWNPIIILFAATTGPGFAAWRCSRSWNLQRFVMVYVTLLGLAVVLGRQPYFDGFDHTTLRRAASDSTTSQIVSHVETWIGPLLVLSAAGLLLVLWQWGRKKLSRSEAVTMVLMLVGGLLAPANQLRIHTLLSLEKHADIGATFAAIPAGYLLARLVRALGGSRKAGKVRAAWYMASAGIIAAAALIPLNIDGVKVGTQLHNTWPSSTQLVDTLRPLLHKGNDNYLVEDYDVPAYYLPQINYWQWHDTVAATWYEPATKTMLTGAAALDAAIIAHHYQVIVLDYSESPTTDQEISGTIVVAGYRKVAKIDTVTGTGEKGSYTIWVAPTS